MIHVTIVRKSDYIQAFELSGHAESGPYGYDLVCAAVSAVTFGAVNAVTALCDAELEIVQGEEGGYLHAAIPEGLDESKKKRAAFLLESMLVSLETIEREYGQFIRISKTWGGAV